jgi:hypothetical protein
MVAVKKEKGRLGGVRLGGKRLRGGWVGKDLVKNDQTLFEFGSGNTIANILKHKLRTPTLRVKTNEVTPSEPSVVEQPERPVG